MLLCAVVLQSKQGSGVNMTEEQVFEHERFIPIAGWSSRYLAPTERSRYSRYEEGAQSTSTFPDIRLPEGLDASSCCIVRPSPCSLACHASVSEQVRFVVSRDSGTQLK